MVSAIMTVATFIFKVVVFGLGELTVGVLCFFTNKNILSTSLLVLNPLFIVDSLIIAVFSH